MATISNMSPRIDHVSLSKESNSEPTSGASQAKERDLMKMSLEEKLEALDRLVQMEKGASEDAEVDQLLSHLMVKKDQSRSGGSRPSPREEAKQSHKSPQGQMMNTLSQRQQQQQQRGGGGDVHDGHVSELEDKFSMDDLNNSGVSKSELATSTNSDLNTSALNASLLKSYTQPMGFKFRLEKRNPEDRKEDMSLQVEQEKMAECTFQPQVNPLPRSYSRNKVVKGAGLSFYERSVQWKEQLRREMEEKSFEMQLAKERACSFRPNVNPLVAGEEMRSSENGSATMSKGYASPHGVGDIEMYQDGMSFEREDSDIHDRLYSSALQRKLKKEELRQQILEERQQQECPFEPQLITKRRSPTQSRYMRPEYHRKNSENMMVLKDELQSQKDEECTFHPQINKSSRKITGSSQIYLQEDPFQRLSRAKSVTGTNSRTESQHRRHLYSLDNPENDFLSSLDNDLFGNSSVDAGIIHSNRSNEFSYSRGGRLSRNSSSESMKTPSRPSSAMGNSRPSARSRSAGPTRRPQSAMSNHTAESSSSGGTLSPSFQQFLDRQQNREHQKQERMKFIKHSTAPRHNPRINRKSEQMMKRKNANFFDRLKVEVEKRAKKREQLTSPNPAGVVHHEEREYTFEPKINKASQGIPRRSFQQMSMGDWEKMKRNAEMKRKQKEDRELEGFTFKPRINSNPGAKSFLGIQSDPESYMDRVRGMSEKQEERAKTIQMEREQMELKNCTFQPKTHDAPEYVKRIARSMANLREVESQMNESTTASRPDWR